MKKTGKTLIFILLITLGFAGCENGYMPPNPPDGTPDSIPGETTSNNPIVCLGDSLTEGYGAANPGEIDKSKSYPAFLQEKIKVPVVNAGITSDTAADGLIRVNNDVLSEDPQMVIILLGANDFFRMRPANETKADLQEIIGRIENGNRKIYLGSFIGDFSWESGIAAMIPSVAGYSVLLEEYKMMYDELILENGDLGFISDIWTGVWGTHMSDPIHPDEEGYSIMADNIFHFIKPYLQENDLLI